MPHSHDRKYGFRSEDYIQSDEKDPVGRKVDEVFWATEKYQIYRAGNTICFILPDDYTTAAELRERLYQISTERANIESLRLHKAVRDNHKDFAGRMLARCMAQTFEGHHEDALPVLKQLENRLAASVRGYYRATFLGASVVALMIIISTMLIIMFTATNTKLITYFGIDNQVAQSYSKYFLLGATGSFLSVCIGVTSLDIDLDLSWIQHMLAGGSRIIIGMIGALAMALTLDSEFISPGFGKKADQQVYYLITFIAGFSETIVPNTLRRVELAASNAEDPDKL